MQLDNIFKITETLLRKNASEIMMGLGITGMFTATFVAVKATPEAIRRIEERKKEEKVEKLTPIETVKAAGTCYIPAAVLSLISAGCLIGAGSVSKKRNAALATAYGLSESALSLYKEKVVEAVGEKKEKKIQDAVAKERIDSHPVGTSQIIITGKGSELCYDTVSGRYFESNIDKLDKVEIVINKRLISQDYVSLNELYDELGLPGIKVGDAMGWNIRKDKLEFRYSTQLTEDGRACIVVGYEVAPDYLMF